MKRNIKILLGIIVIASILRLYNLSRVPVSLFGDELDVSYQAYSILKTGRDYYGNFMPLHFHSLAEWRTPLYLYSAVPSIALFGISPLGARLPAAIFGILTIPLMYFLIKEFFDEERIGLIGAMSLAISPWHIQYSRAAFEVTQLMFFLVLGLYSFILAVKGREKFLILAGASFCLMPWIYSSAKLFSPMLIIVLVILYLNKLIRFDKKVLAQTALVCLIIGIPLIYNIIFGGGSQRFSYISVFSDPTTESEVGTMRLLDARARGEMGDGLHPTYIDRALHNKYVYWSRFILNNYAKAFSSDFLFTTGDPNPRHSIQGVGQFYIVESIVLLIGTIFLFSSKKINRNNKLIIGLWILLGVIPSAITRDGGNHASRLIIILTPLLIIISYGISRLNRVSFYVFYALLLVNFIFYQHNYWVHNPWGSERWWHYGWEQAVKEVKAIDNNYEKVVISTANEPPWIFFAAWYEYDPKEWQSNFPIGNDVELSGFGTVSHIGKHYFGSPKTESYWQWSDVIDNKTLYLADAKEINLNLAKDPNSAPGGLKLIKTVTFPSGEPAFYLFTGK